MSMHDTLEAALYCAPFLLVAASPWIARAADRAIARKVMRMTGGKLS